MNHYRSQIVDFCGTLSYEEMEDVVLEAGMSKNQYNISLEVLNYYNGDIPYPEYLKIMMERSKEKYDNAHPLTDRIVESTRQIFDSLKDDNLNPQNRFVLLMGIFLFVWFLISKKWTGIFALAAWLFGRLFAWYYILLNGRFPLRIPQGLFLVDIMALLAIPIYFFNDFFALKGVKKKICTVSGIAFCGLVLLFGYQGIQKVEQDTAYVKIYQDRWYGIKEYCMENPQNMYLLNGGSKTLFYFSDNVLDTNTIGQPQNYYANSGFYSLSPHFYKKTGIEPGSDVAEVVLEQGNSYWIYEAGRFSEELSIVQYYKNRYDNFTYELTDTFSTETSSFEVYHFRK